MSEKLRRILVAIRDPKHVPVPQLRKSAAIAQASGASLELFHVVQDIGVVNPRNSRPVDEIALERLQRLERLPIFTGLPIRSHVVRDYPPHEAILKRAAASRADLVVAAPQSRTFGARFVLVNTDWELIHRCSCPLLLIKSKAPYDKPTILTAIDPVHAHAKPANLDPQLLRVGNAWARLLNGESHAFHAFLPLAAAVPMPTGQPMTGWLSPEIEELHSNQIAQMFRSVADKAGIAPSHQHLTVGDVPTEMKRIVKKTNARVVVMGAISRGALKRLFIGSTAERVLDDSSCDILVVKPSALAPRPTRQKKPSRLRAA
jgi:universal stress protein E